mmetsp:Transcript_144473/g.360117  ORF Transcript_144473/g.360117 Transcript_144473/m.360117 type:complete len:93 (+) Transcript_144473:451-729(+)
MLCYVAMRDLQKCAGMAGAFGYQQHKSKAIVASTLSGVASVVLAATWSPIASYRNAFNLVGCAVMLASQYLGEQVAKHQAEEKDVTASGHGS